MTTTFRCTTAADLDEMCAELDDVRAPAPWALALLERNPSYTSWGPGEDYMSVGDPEDWSSSMSFDTWPELEATIALDDLNEVVNFYFSIALDHDLRAHVELTLWLLHPRKGASRGVRVADLTEGDLPSVLAFLTLAAERNATRFARVFRLAPLAPQR